MLSRENFTVSFFNNSSNGLIEYVNGNWTGIAYKFAKKEKDRYKNSLDIKLGFPGIYLLIGKRKNEEKYTVYIGKAETQGIIDRLQQHDKDTDKEFLTEVVAFTKTTSMGPSQACFLESKLYELAKEVKCCKLLNVKTPSSGNISPHEEVEYNKFVDYIKLVMKIMGYNFFEKEDAIEFCIVHSGDKKAVGKLTGIKKEFIVLKGSFINKFSERQLSDKNLKKYKIVIDNDGKLTDDIQFNSPTQAAEFILGYGISGKVAWKITGN